MKTICIAGKNSIAVDILLFCIENYKNWFVLQIELKRVLMIGKNH